LIKNNSEKYSKSTVINMVASLEDEKLLDLISVLLGCTKQEADDGFSIKGMLSLIDYVMENEDVEGIFFMIEKLTEKIYNAGGKEQNKG